MADGMKGFVDFYAWLRTLPADLQEIVLLATLHGEVPQTRVAAEPWLNALEHAHVADWFLQRAASERAAQGGGAPGDGSPEGATGPIPWQ